MMGHLNSFSASGGGNLNKNFPKIQMPGGLPGGRCLSFDLTDTLKLEHIAYCEEFSTKVCGLHFRSFLLLSNERCY